jgi:ureidoglycolate hydrolase
MRAIASLAPSNPMPQPSATPVLSMPRLILPAQPITPAAFAPYGQVISATNHDKAFDAADAQLRLDQGIPRFYIMRLPYRGRVFDRITRHQRCTQCLGSLAGKEWFLGVAPPGPEPTPAIATIQTFRIPGTCFVTLAIGTWHAGPYFDDETVDFYSLELSDTNSVDHDTCNLRATYDLDIEIA